MLPPSVLLGNIVLRNIVAVPVAFGALGIGLAVAMGALQPPPPVDVLLCRGSCTLWNALLGH